MVQEAVVPVPSREEAAKRGADGRRPADRGSSGVSRPSSGLLARGLHTTAAWQQDGVQHLVFDPAALAVNDLSSEDDDFYPGDEVTVRDLVARPELNGRVGTQGEFVEAKGRWEVHLNDVATVLLREQNFVPASWDQ